MTWSYAWRSILVISASIFAGRAVDEFLFIGHNLGVTVAGALAFALAPLALRHLRTS